MARGSQATQPARSRGRRAPWGRRGRGAALAQRIGSSAASRYLLAHPAVAAGLLLGLLVLVYLWPALVQGELLSPISVLYGSTPWTSFAPDDLGGYLNPLLSDVPTADYPWRFLVRSMLHDGAFPSWNPYVFGGIPLWSNPQTGLFSLFSLPLWILPLNYGIGVGAALKLWAAGFGTWLLVRELRLGFLPALLAGVCFSFSAIQIVWLTHDTLPAVAALLPWMLWLVERIFRGGRLGALIGLAVATAVGLGGGHPGMQVHLLAAVAAYALLRAAFMPRDAALGERLRPLAVAAGGLALGVLLVGVMLLPEALSSRGTVGTASRAHGRGTLPGTQMPLTTIRTVLFPDWWGRPSGFEGREPITVLAPGLAVPVNYNERAFYAGAVGLLLALVGTCARGGWRRKGPFVALAFLGLAIPLHFPGLWQLITHLPAFDQVQNQRLHFVWALGLAVLAAFGLQAMLERPAGDRWRLGIGVGAVALGVVALVAAGPSAAALGDTLTHFATGREFHSDAVLALTSVAWYLLFAVGVGVALLAAHRRPARRTWIAAGVVLLAAADMLHFAIDYQPIAPASKAIPPRTDAIAFLQRHRDEGRIFGIETALPNDWSLTYGLRDVRGYDPPQPSQRFARLWRTVEGQYPDWVSFRFDGLSPEALRLLSVLGARYVVAQPGSQLPGEADAGPEEAPVGEDAEAFRALRKAYDGIDARVFANARAAPRALVPARVQVVSGEAEARGVLLEGGFDPRRDALVERGAEGTAALAALGPLERVSAGASGRVSVQDRSAASVAIRARLSRPGLVVLNDSFAPGWSVRVDGRDAPPVRVNEVMRGVAVGAGTHEIAWTYRVPGLRAGAALSAAGLLLLAGLAGALLARRRRVSAANP
ncbi:MAG TPA: YfhO family protein [Conexibacter sp.]